MHIVIHISIHARARVCVCMYVQAAACVFMVMQAQIDRQTHTHTRTHTKNKNRANIPTRSCSQPRLHKHFRMHTHACMHLPAIWSSGESIQHLRNQTAHRKIWSSLKHPLCISTLGPNSWSQVPISLLPHSLISESQKPAEPLHTSIATGRSSSWAACSCRGLRKDPNRAMS